MFVVAAEVMAEIRVAGIASLRRRTIDFVVLIVACLPILVVAMRSGQIAWVPTPAIDDVSAIVSLLGGPVLACALLTIGALGVVSIARSRSFVAALLPLWLTLPLIVAVGVSFVHPIFHPRYLIVSIPALALLVAVGIDSVARRFSHAALIVAGLTAMVAAACVVLSRSVSLEGPREDWRGAAAAIASNPLSVGPKLAIVSPPFATLALQEQIARTPVAGLGVFDPAEGCPITPASWEGCVNARPQVWIIERFDSHRRTSFDDISTARRFLLDHGWRSVQEIDLAHLHLAQFERLPLAATS